MCVCQIYIFISQPPRVHAMQAEALTQLQLAIEYVTALRGVRVSLPPCVHALGVDLHVLRALHTQGLDMWDAYIGVQKSVTSSRVALRGSTFDAVAFLDARAAEAWMERLHAACAALPFLLAQLQQFALELEDNLELDNMLGPASSGASLRTLIAATKRSNWLEASHVMDALMPSVLFVIRDLIDDHMSPAFFRHVLLQLLLIRALLPVGTDLLLEPALLLERKTANVYLLRDALRASPHTLYELLVHLYGRAHMAAFVLALVQRLQANMTACIDEFADTDAAAASLGRLRDAVLATHELPAVRDALGTAGGRRRKQRK